MTTMPTYDTIRVEFQDSVCRIELARPDANNTISSQLVAECSHVLSLCEELATVVVLSGSPEVFCLGADFKGIAGGDTFSPEPMYDLWLRMATGPYVTISHVRGKANAGGVGFVAASDIVLADDTAQFSLSELLFGLYPACVLPFLIRRTGFQPAYAMTLSTLPVQAAEAARSGLVDELTDDTELAVRRLGNRLARLDTSTVRETKDYFRRLWIVDDATERTAVAEFARMMSSPVVRGRIGDFAAHQRFPWESAGRTSGGERRA